MTAKASQKIKSFLVSSLIQALKNQNPMSWKASTYYNLGSQILSDNKVYVCVLTGTSGTVAPTHSTGTSLDGTTQWLFLSSSTNTQEISSNLYLGLGKSSEWNLTDTPDVPSTTTNSEDEALVDLITFVRLTNNDTRMGLKINLWETGTVYSQFDPDIEMSQFGDTLPNLYVMVGDNIYKCIDNNGGAESSDVPTGTQLGLVLMSDGYIWKYMGTVDPLDKIEFSTDDFVPVSIKYTNDASEQWDVQQEAKDGSVSAFNSFVVTGDFFSDTPIAEVIGTGTGATAGVEFNEAAGEFTLTRVYATAGGQDYTQETYAVVKEDGAVGSGAALEVDVVGGEVIVGALTGGSGYAGGAVLVIIGDGAGAEGSLTLSSGVVTVADISAAGAGYTWAKAFIVPGSCGAVSKALMAPIGGHGKNIITELNARTLIISKTIDDTLEPYLVEGEYRQISLIASVQPFDGTTFNSALYIGQSHPDFALNPELLDKYKPGTGHILHINNIEAIEHVTGQQETIKITLTL